MTKKLSIKDIFGIIMLGFGAKKYLVVGLVFFAVGLGVDILTKGTYFLAPYFYMCGGLFFSQIWWSHNSFDVMSASPYRRAAQLEIPTILMGIANTFTMIVALVVRGVFFGKEDFSSQVTSFLFTAVVMIFLSTYISVAYKEYYKSLVFVAVLALFIGGSSGFLMGKSAADGEKNFVVQWVEKLNLQFYHLIIIAIVAVALAVALQYITARALYKKPVDPKAQGAFMRKHLLK